jgi:choline kinase
MSPVKNAVIAAAGLGSRLGMGMPKCMISINNIPILAHTLDLLASHVETIVVVAGYREDLIIEYCQNHYRNVTVARNPDYATTNTAQSLSLGSQFISGKTIYLDGDLLIEKNSFSRFLKLAHNVDLLVGITEAKTENPVFVECTPESQGEYLTVKGFNREHKGHYEWANLFVGSDKIMDGTLGYVYQRITEKLPAKGALIEVEEIDTPRDMMRAEAKIKTWGA